MAAFTAAAVSAISSVVGTIDTFITAVFAGFVRVVRAARSCPEVFFAAFSCDMDDVDDAHLVQHLPVTAVSRASQRPSTAIYESQIQSKRHCACRLCLRELSADSEYKSYWDCIFELDFEPVPEAKAKIDFEMDPKNKHLLALRTSCIEELRRVVVAKPEVMFDLEAGQV